MVQLLGAGLLSWAVVASAATLLASPPQITPPAAASIPASDYVFLATTGLLVFHVRPEATRDFEAVMARLDRALEATTDGARRQQRSTWRLFRSAETTPTSVVYVWLVDPVSRGADYDPVRMITEALPGEAQEVYARLKAAVIKVERMSLAPIVAPPPAPAATRP